MNNRRSLITLCIAGFAGNINFSLLFPVLPYYAEAMAASPSQVGLILASYSYVAAIALIPFGMLSDRVGSRIMLIASLVVFSLAPLLYPLAANLTQLALVRAFHGLASAMFFPAACALALDTTSPGRWGEALGWFTTSTQLALVVGPVLGGVLLNYCGFSAAFYSCSAVPLLGLIFVLIRRDTLPQKSAERVASSDSWSWLKQRKVFAGLAAPFFFTVGSGTIFTFMPLYGQGFGVDEAEAGIIIAALYAGSTLLRIPGGKLSDRFGRKPVILVGLIISGIAIALISFTNFFAGLIAAAALFGAGMGLAMPAAYALVADLTSPRVRGLTMGMTSGFLHAGLAIGPTIMGVVANASGYILMFRSCTLSLILGLLITLILTRSSSSR